MIIVGDKNDNDHDEILKKVTETAGRTSSSNKGKIHPVNSVLAETRGTLTKDSRRAD